MTVPALYLRVSDPRQGENFSLAAQERAGRALCAREGWPEPVIYREEGASAFNDDPDARPQFRALLAAIEAGAVDRLVALDTDRFARSALAALLALARIETARARVHFVNDPIDTSTPAGKMWFTIKGAFHEGESAHKSARIRLSQDIMRAEGRWFNRPPFGARIGDDGRLAVDPAKAPLLARILAEAAEDSDNAIAERLTAEGIPTPGADRRPGRWGRAYSGVWYPSTVRDIVRRSGWLADQPDPWPARWLAARERPRRPKASGARRIRLLSGLMRCPCGGVITYGGRRGPLDRLTVQCHASQGRGRRAGCPHRKTYADVYEADVLRQLLALGDPERSVPAGGGAGAEREREELAEDARRLADVYRAKLITKAQFEADLLAIEARRAALPGRAARYEAARAGWPAIRDLLPRMEPADANAVARQLIERVTIDGRAARIAWRPEVAAIFGLAADRGGAPLQ